MFIGFLEVVGWFGTLGMMAVLSLDFLEPALFLGVGLGEEREKMEDLLVAVGFGSSDFDRRSRWQALLYFLLACHGLLKVFWAILHAE